MKKMSKDLMFLFAALLIALPVFAQNAGSVSGTVSSRDGVLIANASVLMVDNERNMFETLTGRDGMFAFDRLPAGEYHITASHARLGFVQDDIEVAPNEETVIELILPGDGGGGDERFGSVRGSVLTEQREPAAFAVIIMISERREVFQTMTNGRGEFNYERIPTGQYFIQAVKDGEGSAEDNLVVENGAESVIELLLERGPGNHNGFGSVVGHVFSANGQPVFNAEVHLAGERHNNHRTQTDEQGRFAFERVPASTYNIMSATLREGAAMEQVMVRVDEQSEINLVLSRGMGGGGDNRNPGEIVGSVITEAGDAIANAEVLLAGGGSNVFRVLTDDLGNFTIAQIPGGSYHITAVLDAFGIAEDDVVITAHEQTEVFIILGSDSGGSEAVEDQDVNIPINPVLLNSYPNPFNAVLTVDYNLPEACLINLAIFNTAGRQLQVLSDGWQSAGDYQTSFNGQSLPTGTYILRLEAGKQTQLQRLVLLK